jgi:5'-phosphate synthase pdxT subunit
VVRVSQVSSKKVVGVLALQGAFESHKKVLNELDVVSLEVRTPQDLAQVDALIMPGGESTTMSQLLESSDLYEPIKKLIH